MNDDEIVGVVARLEKERPQNFELDFAEWGDGGAGSGGGGGDNDVVGNPKYAEAVEFVTDQGRLPFP